MINQMPRTVYEIIYPFPNFNGCIFLRLGMDNWFHNFKIDIVNLDGIAQMDAKTYT